MGCSRAPAPPPPSTAIAARNRAAPPPPETRKSPVFLTNNAPFCAPFPSTAVVTSCVVMTWRMYTVSYNDATGVFGASPDLRWGLRWGRCAAPSAVRRERAVSGCVISPRAGVEAGQVLAVRRLVCGCGVAVRRLVMIAGMHEVVVIIGVCGFGMCVAGIGLIGV